MFAIFNPHRQPAFLAIKKWELEMAEIVELKQIFLLSRKDALHLDMIHLEQSQ